MKSCWHLLATGVWSDSSTSIPITSFPKSLLQDLWTPEVWRKESYRGLLSLDSLLFLFNLLIWPLCPACGILVPQFNSVQLLSCVWLFAIPQTAAHQASLSIINSWNLLKLMSTESVMPSNHLILCHPLLLLPPIFSSIRVSSNELVFCIRWSKYWSSSFSISPSNKHSGFTSFRIDWFDFLAVQELYLFSIRHCARQ